MIEQGGQCRRYHRADARSGQFGLVVVVLQVGVHRHAGQDAIVQGPGARGLPQQQIRPWPHAQGRQPSVYALGIGLQCRTFAAGGHIQAGVHTGAQAVHAVAFVQIQRSRAEQFGQFASWRAAHQVHFEIALLRMHVPQRTQRIALAGGVDGDHAAGIAEHADRRAQAT